MITPCFLYALLALSAWTPRGASDSVHLQYVLNNNPADVPRHEYDALYDLYIATAGQDWTWGQQPGNEWNFTVYTNPCADFWEGVTCLNDASDGYSHVNAISLRSYYLVGSIPVSIGNLSYLVNLTLSENWLSQGVLPVSIGQLYLLQRLDLYESSINGPILKELGRLPSLQILDISFNNLFGPIPESFCTSTTVTDLSLAGNVVTTTIPECIGQINTLRYFDVSFTRMVGTVPSSLGNLANLVNIDLSANRFSGTIPDSFAQLHQLGRLSLSLNNLNGTVPAFLGSLLNLYEFDLDENEFTGTIPNSLGNLQNLDVFYLSGNRLNGTIPNSLTTIAGLLVLNVQFNYLSGTIPAGVGNLAQVLYFSMYGNQLTGTIPEAYCSLMYLSGVDLGSNQLSGTIPESCGYLPLAVFFVASANALTGTIPAVLFVNPNVHTIALSSNYLTGPLPQPRNDAISLLSFFSVGVNQLTGTVPELLTNFPLLLYVNLSDNYLTGTISRTFCDLLSLNYLYLDDNALTGTIPTEWRNHTDLSYVFFDRNYLVGTIPDKLAALDNLQSLNLSSNYLTGRIPANFSRGVGLVVFMLSYNMLTGPIGQAFDPDFQHNLGTVQLSNNQLTGTLPDAIFLLPNLQVFAAVSNCFTGSIPESACLCSTLHTLALDGLQSASSCQNKLFPSSFDGIVSRNLYSIDKPLTGGIPPCLFQMANLTTLHLSGNGLTGTLPADITVSATLTDLSLSHNKLEGSIPASMLGRNWSNLDLSYNVFKHSLSLDHGYTLGAKATLSLQQNRLSGKIPIGLADLCTISILESNLFACNAERSDLPQDDPNRGKYQCGSDTLDATIYAWIAVGGALAVVGLLWWRRSAWATEVASLRRWWEAQKEPTSSFQHYRLLSGTVQRVLVVTAVCALFALAVLLPLYAALSARYGTYTHVYAWTLSAAYLSGIVAFALMFLFLALIVVVALVTLRLTERLRDAPEQPAKPEAAASTEAEEDSPVTAEVTVNRVIVYGSFVAINFMIVLGVNIAYVVIALNQNGEALTLAQISLALFKVAFNGVCSPLLIRWTSHRVLKSSEEASTADLISIQLFVTLVNNILIPCLVVAIISPDCFYNIFDAASEVTTSFSYPGKCLQFDPYNRHFVTCALEETLISTTKYNPPFDYSYQCSSSFITYYAPAYVIMCIIASFGIPVAQVLLQRLHSRAVKGTRWFALLDLLLPRILKSPDIASPPAARNVFAPYFDATQHMITLLTYVGLLLTFGAVFPPLALCFAVTIASIAAFTKLKVGRFLSLAEEQEQPQYLIVIDQECAAVSEDTVISQAMNAIIVFCFLFYTLFLFDTLGDTEGVGAAWWVLLVTPLLAGVVLLVSAVLDARRRPRALSSNQEGQTELVTMETRSPFVCEVANDDKL